MNQGILDALSAVIAAVTTKRDGSGYLRNRDRRSRWRRGARCPSQKEDGALKRSVGGDCGCE